MYLKLDAARESNQKMTDSGKRKRAKQLRTAKRKLKGLAEELSIIVNEMRALQIKAVCVYFISFNIYLSFFFELCLGHLERICRR